MNLQEDLGIDSLDIVAIVLALEKEFGISITAEPHPANTTIEDLFNIVREAQAAQRTETR